VPIIDLKNINIDQGFQGIEPIPGVPIFMIDNKPYHLRVLTPRES